LDTEQTVRAEVEIDAQGLTFTELNAKVREAAIRGAKKIVLCNVHGQRYIGTRLYRLGSMEIEIHGTPGNDLGAFLDGHRIVVYSNAQDGTGNTMNSGEIVVHGRAGDILGMSMRGGEIFIRDSVGYRAGLHMKEYGEKRPVLVVGGTTQDFLGEYMAGGIIIILNLDRYSLNKMDFVGTGMHGGVIYIRGEVQTRQLSKQVELKGLEDEDYRILSKYIDKYAAHFNISKTLIMERDFSKLQPISNRPYSNLYAHLSVGVRKWDNDYSN
jgi:glutamate synthase domain-containing protein 3